jgi:hypothetical protein
LQADISDTLAKTIEAPAAHFASTSTNCIHCLAEFLSIFSLIKRLDVGWPVWLTPSTRM